MLSGIVDDWDKGILPVAGGSFAQPAKLVEAVRLIHSARNHCQHMQNKMDAIAAQIAGGGHG
jgi:hypothetical protein